MSPDEVVAVTECGPYKFFKNGDVETYKGLLDGKEQNFQFFFTDRKLRRIGIYLYEGQNLDAGANAWLDLHGVLSKLFGSIETPGNIRPGSEESQRSSFKATAAEVVRGVGKAQMAPLDQPADAAVFSSFQRRQMDDGTYYYVTLYFDARPAP